MLSNQEVEEKLLRKSIKENDPRKDDKTSEIKHWCFSYGELLEDDIDEWFDFVANVFKEENSWKHPQPSEGDQPVKLDRDKIFEALSGSKCTINNKLVNNPISDEDRYQIACWGNLEENIKNMFEEIFVKGYGVNENDEDYKEKLCVRIARWFPSPLASFWSHFIYRESSLISDWVENEFSENGHSKFKDLAKKYKDFSEKKYFAIGFEYAAEEGKDDAMKFFIDRVPVDRRKDMLIDAATAQNANVVAIRFCLDNLGSDNYKDLLMGSYDGKFKHYSRILNNLVSKHYFKEAMDLLESWSSIVSKEMEEKKSEQLSEGFKIVADYLYDDYSGFIYGMLDEMTMPKHAASFEETDNFVYKMLSDPNLKIYKDLFIIDVSKKQFTPCRDKMATLLRRDNKSKAVFHILESANEEQCKSIISSTEFSLLPYFLSDLKPELRKKLESYGVTKPDYNKSTEPLEQSIPASTIEDETGSPIASHFPEKSPFSSNVSPAKSEDSFDN